MPLLEHDAAKYGSHRHIEGCDSHDDAWISRLRAGVELHDIAGRGEWSSNRGTRHHDPSRFGRDGFGEVAIWPYFAHTASDHTPLNRSFKPAASAAIANVAVKCDSASCPAGHCGHVPCVCASVRNVV